ncbi:MAG: hypothetical protein OZSIB_3245 [Candidatus Ozemobacter sibiricus]|jgi:prepilin-type N-terminal cleavage/methylation domain-containing protein|uniref:Prepilin-type N-terminal cleavage/methylation domain-containing protein n=1 Tax=Candidatus Ozemobacter sibiricus TaxID=2268124 RepID=A0A367ZRX9_9BACT|nr:MAG: hypothetical protein OZSIB_3245 [Candidatus Ozemobacter sibiricus]
MSRRRATTLIELMIAIAILGITMGALFSPVQQLLEWSRRADREFQNQEAVTIGFAVLKGAFRQALEVRWRSEDEVVCLGLQDVIIRRREQGRVIEVAKKGGLIRLDFLEGARFGPFHPVDERTVWGAVFLGTAKVPMFWRCGL